MLISFTSDILFQFSNTDMRGNLIKPHKNILKYFNNDDDK